MVAMILPKSKVENETQARKSLGLLCFKEHIHENLSKCKYERVLL